MTAQITWSPSHGVDRESLVRMLGASQRPSVPMGEAWFMGDEREMFTDALTTGYEQLPYEYVSRMLEAIGSGTTCFGELAEWREWFDFLFPRGLQHPFDTYAFDYRVELLMTALFALYPSGFSNSPYKNFGNDTVATAGRVIMNPELWDGDRLRIGSGLFCESRRYGEVWWYFDQTHPVISASMFFCLKYLRPDQVGGWFASAAEIRCPYWRAQLITWLLGAKPFLEGHVTQPSEFEKLSPDIRWESSHILAGYYDGHFPGAPLVDAEGRAIPVSRQPIPFVPGENRRAFITACNGRLVGPERAAWIDQVTRVPLLKREMGHLAEQFSEFRLEAGELIPSQRGHT
jgi:hypothetical protein